MGGEKMEKGSVSTDVHVESSITEDESSRLSRRSSVIQDLLSLFRRSSSLHFKSHPKLYHEGDEEDDDDTEAVTKEKILEAIRQKKEIIGRVRYQPWTMDRKRTRLRAAKGTLQREEGKVSKIRLYQAEAQRKMGQINRFLDNLKIYLIPWEAKIKKIESHYGSVVSSYFTFLRWVLMVNITLTLMMCLGVVIPEWLADSKGDSYRFNATRHIKEMPPQVRARADMITTVWDLGGYFQYSLFFYGYFSKETFFGETIKYRVPVAYFFANILVLAYSFFIILRNVLNRMASNARTSKHSSTKTEQYVFNWKTFAGWDYTIGNPETSSNLFMANVIKFKEAIAEYNVRMKETLPWYRFAFRAFAWIIYCGMLALSVWAILAVSKIKEKDTFMKQNAVSITVSSITLIYPNIFDLMAGIMEKYHARTALRFQLARVMVVYIVNYFTLMYSLYMMVEYLEIEKRELEKRYGGTVTRSQRTLLIPMRNYSNDYYLYSTASPAYYNISSPYPNSSAPFFSNTTTPPYLNSADPPVSITNLSKLQESANGKNTPSRKKERVEVLPDFGPFAVSAPRAVVSNGSRKGIKSVFISHPIGPNANWTDPSYIPLNFTGKANSTESESEDNVESMRPVSSQYRVNLYEDLCWETIIGQEITKIIIMDLIMTVASILVIDFFRGLFIRYFNLWWFWNLEKAFVSSMELFYCSKSIYTNLDGYQNEFVYSRMIWMGIFFCPLLPLLNNIKLILVMYIRGWACMTCNVPARQIFRASRSSNFYLLILLVMLFLCTLPVGYVIASKTPSKSCGPFAGQPFFYSVIIDLMNRNLNKNLIKIINYMSSPGIVVPVIVLLLLIIYFLFALTRAQRQSNKDLTQQLMQERTEERKKIFDLAGGGKRKDTYHSLLIAPFTNRKRLQPSKKFPSNNISSEEDSKTSLPRSTNSIKNFVPSLGSVSEVESTGTDEEEGEEGTDTSHSHTHKLTLKQHFLICIGLADPKNLRYSKRTSNKDLAREEEERVELIPREAHGQRESSSDVDIPSSSSSSSLTTADDEQRTSSFITASQGNDANSRDQSHFNSGQSLAGPGHVLAGELVWHNQRPSSGYDSPSSPSENTRTHSRGALERIRGKSDSGSGSSASISRRERERRRPEYCKGGRLEYCKEEDGQTRPPSHDESLQDDASHDSNLHCSYTSAMMSPIMGSYTLAGLVMDVSENETLQGSHLSQNNPDTPSAVLRYNKEAENKLTLPPPRFRISTSPPKTPSSEKRQFELRVAPSPKPHRKGRQKKEEAETKKPLPIASQQTTV